MISDSLATRNHTICKFCTVASFGQSAPREHTDILRWVIVIALSVFGWHVYVHYVFNWNVHLNV